MGSKRFERIVATLSRRQPDLSLALENVHKTRNFGALARTCDATGIGVVHAITRDPSTVSLGHRSAGGISKWMSVRIHVTIQQAYAEFRERGFTILATSVGAGTVDFREVDFGGEWQGLFVQTCPADDEWAVVRRASKADCRL